MNASIPRSSFVCSRKARCLLQSQLQQPFEARPETWLRHRRHVSSTRSVFVESRDLGKAKESAKDQTEKYDDLVAQEKDKQLRTPWHREGSDLPPVGRPRSASAMTKGKLLTTPSRLLKLIIPLTTVDRNSDRKDVQPLALLVHPQQPLSYLERLIQAELPTITAKDGQQRIPSVHFKAEDLVQDEIKPQRAKDGEKEVEEAEEEEEEEETEEEKEGDVTQEQGSDEIKVEGKTVHTGKIGSEAEENAAVEADRKAEKKRTAAAELRGGPGEGGVEMYSGSGQDATDSEAGERQTRLVRWSSSTDIGDFIRDAARGKEFAVEIEGSGREIMVGVPSFGDRTHYLRSRLRKASRRIADMAAVKLECDRLAHRSAQRVAVGGFAGLVSWWVGVWYLTFQTSLGWDVMEPVTYLVGLSTLIGGYLWFLYHNREVSYKSALNLTVSRRQGQLYQARGFDLHKWEALVQDANALRLEIKKVADEYDVEWDEAQEVHDEKVVKALKEERERKKERDEQEEEDDEERKKEQQEK